MAGEIFFFMFSIHLLCLAPVLALDPVLSLTLNCNDASISYTQSLRSCTDSSFYVFSMYSTAGSWFSSMTFNDITLASELGKNPSAWIGVYDWNMQAASANNFMNPDLGCHTGDRICRSATTCKMTQATSYFSQTNDCVLCPPRPCTPDEQKCRNGFVALAPGLKASTEINTQTGFKYVYQMPMCQKSCSPGYWLTCLNSDNVQGCSYLVPNADMTSVMLDSGSSQADKDRQVAQWIQQNRAASGGVLPVVMILKFGLLINECYPCSYANGLSHYGEPLLLVDNNLLQSGYLSFYCPGGGQAPVLCPPGHVSKIDNATKASGPCQCMDGYYATEGGGCQACPAGYYCTFNSGKLACPTDTYSVAGASACTPCSTDNTLCGATQALTRCVNGQQTQNAQCIDCQLCMYPGTSTGVPCQRVSQAITAG